MPKQNRVTPFGEIIATPERGEFIGNRGNLHGDGVIIKRPWQTKRWIVCVRDFKGRKRAVMSPGLYTELFFLDEATALAAGHRPCKQCRLDAFKAFTAAFGIPRAPDIDKQLHAERVDLNKSQCKFPDNLAKLPDGVFVTLPGDSRAFLLWKGHVHPWSPGGYGEPMPADRQQQVLVLTPRTTVTAIRNGYVPHVDPSADRT